MNEGTEKNRLGPKEQEAYMRLKTQFKNKKLFTLADLATSDKLIFNTLLTFNLIEGCPQDEWLQKNPGVKIPTFRFIENDPE